MKKKTGKSAKFNANKILQKETKLKRFVLSILLLQEIVLWQLKFIIAISFACRNLQKVILHFINGIRMKGEVCVCILTYTQEVSYWKISTVELNSTYLPNNYRRITWKRRKLLKEFRFFYSFNVSVSFVRSFSTASIHPLSSRKLNSRSLIRKTAWQIILTMLKIGPLFLFFRKWNQQICLYPRNQPIQTNLQSVTNTRLIINRVKRGREWKKKYARSELLQWSSLWRRRKKNCFEWFKHFLPHCNTTDNASRLWFTIRLRVNWIQFVTLESLIEKFHFRLRKCSNLFFFYFFSSFVIFWMCHGIKSIAISVFLSFEFKILNAMLFVNFQLFYFNHKHKHTVLQNKNIL